MYKSPIEIIQQQLQTSLENEILTAVKKVGVIVDKEELIRALKYDRNQYHIGYKDGKAAAMASIVRCNDCNTYSNGTCWKMRGKMNPDDFCSYGERRTDG